MTPIYTIELDRGDGTVAWEFYECGTVKFVDRLEGIVEEWAPAWEYDIE